MHGYVVVLFILPDAEGMERFTVVGKFAKRISKKILKENKMDKDFDLDLEFMYLRN